MAEKKKTPFVLSDQSDKNQFGIVILTAAIDGTTYTGISLEDFLANPVMCLNHNTETVLGKWSDVHVDKAQHLRPLLAFSDFDEEDEIGKKYSSKVERGYVKGASAWIEFDKADIRTDVPGFEGKLVITKSILREASIAPVPENRNALKLSDKQGNVWTKETVLKFSSELKNQNQNQNPMNKLLTYMLTLAGVFKLSATATEEDGINAIKTLVTEHERVVEENKALNLKLTAQHDKNITDLVDGAVTAGKILAAEKDTYLKLAKSDYENTKTILDAKKAHVALSAQIHNKLGAEGAANNEDRSNWTFSDWDKKDSAGLLKMKAERSEEYEALVAGVRNTLKNSGAIQ